MLKVHHYISSLFISGMLMVNSAYSESLVSEKGAIENGTDEVLTGSLFNAGAVFVMTNDVLNNEIAMYGRAENGKLLYTGRVSTGGQGSLTQPIDPLASQNSLILTENDQFLLASNPGSNEISVFSVSGHALQLVDKVSSNGIHPVSITVNGDIVYVLNTGGDGAIAGFRLTAEGQLNAIPNSIRSLNLNGTVPPQTNDVNHQILFNPYGDRIIVSGGINTNQIKVYDVDGSGLISVSSVDVDSSGANPFSLIFSRYGDLIVAEGEGTNALSSYDLRDNNTLSAITNTVFNGKSFSCWLVGNGSNYIYLINTGTDDISLYETSRSGVLTLVDADIVSLGQGALQTDASFSKDGKYLYTVNGGTGMVGVLKVYNSSGHLEVIQRAGGLEDHALLGMQGIAAY